MYPKKSSMDKNTHETCNLYFGGGLDNLEVYILGLDNADVQYYRGLRTLK